jgi:predicted metal-dependent peptidase
LDWRILLRRYAGQVLEIRPVYNRPSRRFPELVGILPGKARQALRPKVLAAIDTSGSITPELLTLIDGELGCLAKHHEVTVVECDARIHAVYPYRKLDRVHGRGGTDLRPPLEKSFLGQHKPDLVVYFTDGYGHGYGYV